MQETYTAIVKQDDGVWIGWVEEVPSANRQNATREELLGSLRTVLAEAIVFNRADTRGPAGSGYEEHPVAP